MLIIESKHDFEEGYSQVQLYKPVKVIRSLKDEFNNGLSRHFMVMGIEAWSMTVYPLKKYYKFQRKNL